MIKLLFMNSIKLTDCCCCFYAFTGKQNQWDFIHGLFENAIYGGRVDNPFDMQVLRSYLGQYFNGDVLGGGSAKMRGKKLASGLTIPSSAYFRVSSHVLLLCNFSNIMHIGAYCNLCDKCF